MIISLDTETTGVDLARGAMPFLVTTCDAGGAVRFWEWDVDPLTRQPDVPEEDLEQIGDLIAEAELIYLQNSQFDARALAKIGLELPWPKVRDTLIAGHLLATNHPHDLTSMCYEYLGRDIERYEVSLKEVVRECRDLARKHHPNWRIAREGDPDMPSVAASSSRDEDKPWKNDLWLPRAYVRWEGEHDLHWRNPDDRWLTAARDYANADSIHTLALGVEQERLIRERGLWAIYLHRLEVMRVYCEMIRAGFTINGEYTERNIATYEEYVAEAEEELRAIAAEYRHDLVLAQGASINDNMRDFLYGAQRIECPRCGATKRIKHWNGERGEAGECPKCLKGGRRTRPYRQVMKIARQENLNLPVILGAKTGNASLDGAAMREYLQTLDGPALDFVRLLADKRKRDTDLMYMRQYRRFWVPIPGAPGHYRIHPNLNPCATDHLRGGSNSPNLQNVSKQEDECDECDGEGGTCAACGGTGKSRLSTRRCFGPEPGYEYWDFDFRSIENRIPPYECGEEKAIEVFENAGEAPYWGSLYYLTASVLYADEFWPLKDYPIDHPDGFKKRWPKLYKKAKFFNLAKQYGAGSRKGDLLSGIKNSYRLVDDEFPRLAALQARYLADAERTGYVETLPDRTVDPTRGYPILAARTDEGRVLSTTPFNYHVSGSACWAKCTAAVRCSAQCAEWRREGFEAWMCLEVHDSLVFRFRRGRGPEENLPRARVLQRLMEQSGEDFIPRIPTPVAAEYVAGNWAEGVAL